MDASGSAAQQSNPTHDLRQREQLGRPRRAPGAEDRQGSPSLHGLRRALTDDLLLEEATVLVGMVAADASEVQVAAYLGHLEDRCGRPRSSASHRRLEAIAVWHIAKAALTRDRAIALLRGDAASIAEEHERLSDWLAERIARGE